MKHLFLRIYFALIVAIFATGAVVFSLFSLFGPYGGGGDVEGFRGPVNYLVRDLPSGESLDARLAELGDALNTEISVYDADGHHLASTHSRLAGDRLAKPYEHMEYGPRMMLLLQGEDGRWFATRRTEARSHEPGGLLVMLLVLFVVMAAVSYPVAKGITKRINRLKEGVDRWGAGALHMRVEVKGKDEVAQLAAHFNRAAEQIEALLKGQKRLLANASHELRSPLARIRMGLELMSDRATSDAERERLGDELAGDINELDVLVGDLLLASRLEAKAVAPSLAVTELLAFVAEEAVRTGSSVEGETVEANVDPTLLKRALRNLLENASRYGGADVLAAVSVDGGEIRVTVADRGPGVPEASRSRIFEPFYRVPGRAEGQGGGAGLGLALVKEIAELHGGSVSYQPREGGGSSFTIRLPRVSSSDV